jgi:type IV pilus assembly protein PilV
MIGRTNTGFTLIEVLVSMLIFLVSALGIAGLVVRNIQHETEAYQRVQAVVLLQNMVDRLSANRQVAGCYSNSASGLDVGTDKAEADIPACSLGSATQNDQADADLLDWDQLLKGAAEQQGANNVGAMAGARGCVRQVDAVNRIYRISVSWQGLAPTAVQADQCGKDNYGDELYRRTLSAVLRLGDLT